MTGYESKSKFIPSEWAIQLIAEHHFEGDVKLARADCKHAEKDGELQTGWRDLDPGESGYEGTFKKTMHNPNYLRADLERIYGQIFGAGPAPETVERGRMIAAPKDGGRTEASVWYGDDEHLEKMQKLLQQGGAISSVNAAAFAVVDGVKGSGNVFSRAKRLTRKYKNSGRYNPKHP